eukprot:1277793-Amphidinium_carterae.1
MSHDLIPALMQYLHAVHVGDEESMLASSRRAPHWALDVSLSFVDRAERDAIIAMLLARDTSDADVEESAFDELDLSQRHNANWACFPYPLGRGIALLMQLLLRVHTVSWAPLVMQAIREHRNRIYGMLDSLHLPADIPSFTMPFHVVCLLQSALEDRVQHDFWPVCFHEVAHVFLPKVCRPTVQSSELRPIVLKNSLAKLLPAVYAHQLRQQAKERLTSCQFGGILGRSIGDAYLVLEKAALHRAQHYPEASILSVDLKTLVPSIRRSWCMSVLRASGAREQGQSHLHPLEA